MTEQLTRGNRVKDARGRTVTLLDPVMLQVFHRDDVIEADALEVIIEELEPGTAKWRRHALIIGLVVVVAIAGLLILVYSLSGASGRKDLISTLLNPAIMAPNLVCCILVPWITARAARFKRVQAVLLRHRRCPHCGYNLQGLPTASEDAATVCPECGSAWLLDAAAVDAAAAGAVMPLGQKRVPVLIAVGVLLFAGLAAGVVAFLYAR